MRNTILGAIVMACASVTVAHAQGSVWDGVYSDSQAGQGAQKYGQYCVMCHGKALEGDTEAPPLNGRFIPDWDGMTLADLFEKIQTTMPLFAPGTLSTSDTADILAFLLKSNGFPAGKDLEPGESLKAIRIETLAESKAPKPKAKPKR